MAWASCGKTRQCMCDKGIARQDSGRLRQGMTWLRQASSVIKAVSWATQTCGKGRDVRKTCRVKKWRERRAGDKPRLSAGGQNNKFDGCFICKGSHLSRDCPKIEMVAALITGRDELDGKEDEPDEVSYCAPLDLLKGVDVDGSSRMTSSRGRGDLLVPWSK
ncbi:hypothetical protein RND71_012559 [Anisodus tanguticus]|uniref:CCHC-type domain-containing protein n=1 Tax=Anisodus tanguticus TaxID=243964 RepID=A0AAE1VH27_9SOLA|nr:hypothetical protein RND71_012559 [Anisodus tanguticus]